jgi:hypothetical protein
MDMSKEQLVDVVRQYVGIKDQMALLAKRESELKKRLSDVVEAKGEVDGKGHIVLEINDSTSGVGKLVKQRKVSKSLDEDAANRILAEKNLTETCIEMVPQINQDAVMASFFKGLLTEEDVDTMYPSKVTYAFLVNR